MDILLYFIIYLIVPILLFGYIFFNKRYSYWENRGVAHLTPKYFFGNLSGKFFWDIKESYEKLKQHKPFIGLYTFYQPSLIITDLDFLKTIIIKDFDYFHDRGFYNNERDDPLTMNLFHFEGTKWKNMRSKLTPTFSSGKMKFMFPTVCNLANRLSDTTGNYIKENNGKSAEIEIKDLMTRFTTDVIGTCAFGIECNSLKDPTGEFFIIGKSIFTPSPWGTFPRFFRMNFRTLAQFFRLREYGDKYTNFFKKVVDDTIEFREKNDIHRKDFMDLLIGLKNTKDSPLTLSEILASVFAFFAAGYETSSSLMTFTLYEMSQHLDIQKKVRNEIESVCRKYNGEFTYESLQEMTYLEQVINEGLRLHTPAPCPFRICTKDYKVPNMDLTIEKGTNIFLPYHMIHLDPNYYENPDKFNPDNFTPEAVSTRHPMAFIPFGDGPRNCIGMRFGRMQAKIGLAIILKNYKFTRSQNTKVPIEIDWEIRNILPPKGLLLEVEKVF